MAMWPKLFRFLVPVFLLLQTACADTVTGPSAVLVRTDTGNRLNAGSTALVAEVPLIFPDDTLSTIACILNNTAYHGDEVDTLLACRPFMGLFFGGGQYYVDTAIIRLDRVYDPVLDEHEAEPSGIEVKSLHRDSPLFLFSGAPLRIGQVNPVLMRPEAGNLSLKPGESRSFTAGKQQYTLTADGQISEGQISNYRLWISGTRGGQQHKQLLAARPSFDDAAIEILFCGDLDGDTIPDLIINAAGHYNVFQPVLYLSATAAGQTLYKLVAMHTSVGC